MYAINKSAAQGLGAQSLLNDLNVTLDVRVYTDATTGKSMASRRGLGKVRHISVNELWIQEHVRNKTITRVKIKNKFSPSDILTKYLTKAEVEMIMEHLQNFFEKGRPSAAPNLALKVEYPAEDQHLVTECPAVHQHLANQYPAEDQHMAIRA